jgi:hypothetical protein
MKSHGGFEGRQNAAGRAIAEGRATRVVAIIRAQTGRACRRTRSFNILVGWSTRVMPSCDPGALIVDFTT